MARGWRRTGPPRPPRRPVTRDYVFRAEDGWGCPATGPAESQFCNALLRNRAAIRVDDFAPGREPDSLVFFHVREGTLEIPAAERLPDDHRMQGHAEHSWLLRAIGVERVELVDDGLKILLARVALSD